MNQRRTIDLNCDLGERDDPREDVLLLDVVTSVNIACGGHAGDEGTMRVIARAAVEKGVALGAHPSYPDRANFGRIALDMTARDVESLATLQIVSLARIARSLGVRLAHVKPHGALYHDASSQPDIARAIFRAAESAAPGAAIVLRAGSAGAASCRAAGACVREEAFADRAYERDGSLRSRALPGAVIDDPDAAAAQALALRAGTICVHSDTPGALEIARTVRRALEDAGYRLAPPLSRRSLRW